MPRSRSTSRTRTSTPRRRSATRKDASSPLAREPSPEPEPPKPPGVLQTLLSLARLKMTVFSAVTYSTAFSLGLQLSDSAENLKSNFPYATFLLGYLFMFLCQLSAHLLGEFYDLPSDSINAKGKGGPFTGGSRVLVDGTRDPKIALWGGWAASMAAGLIFGALKC